MNMLSNEKIKFKSLEENTFKEMMKLGEIPIARRRYKIVVNGKVK